MTSRRSRPRSGPGSKSVRRSPPLAAADRTLVEALELAVECFQEMARGWLSSEEGRAEGADQRSAAFDDACVKASGHFAGANLGAILAGPAKAAGAAIVGLITELASLGRPLLVGSGEQTEPFVPDETEENAEEILAFERENLLDRLEAIEADPEIAGLLVGVHLARKGENDPFAFPAWSDEVRGESLLAAALAAASLARLDEGPAGAPSEGTPTANALIHAVQEGKQRLRVAGVMNALIHVVQAAWLALPPLDRDSFGPGFGPGSQVIESCLLSSDLLPDLDVADIHRLSAKLIGAFLAGLAGEPPDLEDESREPALALLAAANAVGLALEANERADEQADELGSFELRPSHRGGRLLN